jgi:hypothetical protein
MRTRVRGVAAVMVLLSVVIPGFIARSRKPIELPFAGDEAVS